MATLYDIVAEYRNLLEIVEENEGEITPELEAAFSINTDNYKDKIKSMYYVIKSIDKDIELGEDEINRLKTIIQKKEKTKENIKQRIKESLLIFGEEGKSGNKKLNLDGLLLYNVYNKPLKYNNEDVFKNDPKNDKFFKFSITNLTVEQKEKLLSIAANELSLFLQTKHELNTSLLKETLAQGVEVEGCEIDTTANYIVFR